MTGTALTTALGRIAHDGVSAEVALAEVRGVADAGDARALLAAIAALPATPWGRPTGSPLRAAVMLARRPLSEEAASVLRSEGMDLLASRLEALLAQDPADEDAPYLVRTIALFGTEHLVGAVAALADHQPDSGAWPVILAHLEGVHEHTEAVIAALTSPLRGGFVEVALLDVVNNLHRAGRTRPHAFDRPAGHARLSAMLESDDPDAWSLAHSAAAAVPFLAPGVTRDTLLALGLDHPDAAVRAQTAWAAARLDDPRGVPLLVGLCGQPQTAWRAERYLAELGADDEIPEAVSDPDFRACMAMSEWLEHPQEYGRTPTEVSAVWSGTIQWPPAGDRRRMTVVRYRFDDGDGTPDEGQGLVGHITFAMLGETSAVHTPRELLALHCAWETLVSSEGTSSHTPTIEAGLAALEAANPTGGLP